MNRVEIPQPPPRLILGNLPDLRRKATFIESLMDIAPEHDGIFQLQTPMGRVIVVSDPLLARELCDEERFDKVLGPALLRVRQRVGDGLFTAFSDEKSWHLAHRILMPTFSHASMKAYVPDMTEIAFQLMDTLQESSNSNRSVDVPAEMTKLTLDTIALCGFSFRFNSFRQAEQHPFVHAMVEVLTEQQNQAARPAALNKVMVGARRRMQAFADVMDNTVLEIIRSRREGGRLEGREDLLEHMLYGVDKVTGESLSDDNIRAQCITFLVAGHETTSGLLSFATYYLMKNPDLAARAQAEVDRVLGQDLSQAPTYEQIHSLDFIAQILEESLRLWPTAPAFSRGPRKEPGEMIGGKYFIPYGQACQILLPAVHRATSVWGEDAEDFKPDRFSPESKQEHESAVFLPFGTGARACIGRQFAMQEAKLVLGMLLQRFHLVDSENYELRVKQSLTIKPDGFYLKLRQRAESERQPRVTPTEAIETAADAVEAPVAAPLGLTLRVLYGSNLGTCEGFADELAHEAQRRGFDAKAVSLDTVVGHLSGGHAAIICSSYNGDPPDNATAFKQWLEDSADLGDLKFGVFGCGNREWSNTYQKVPRELDAALERKGGRRLLTAGEGDASGDLDDSFRTWKDAFWTALYASLQLEPDETVVHQEPRYSVQVLEDEHPNPFAEVYDATPMVVVENRELQHSEASQRSTRHIELALPEGAVYHAGDHLGVIPENAPVLVARVAKVFGFTPEVRIQLHRRGDATSALPTDRILSVGTLLTHYVELQDVATRHQIGLLVRYAENPAQKNQLEKLAGDTARYTKEIKANNRSLVDVLEAYPSVRLPFAHYLELVAPLRPRYYSISSSPEASGRILSLTVGVVDGPTRDGLGRYLGTCSNYLASFERGQSVYGFVQHVSSSFGLPSAPSTPIVMIGAGTGLAPYRGFLQERAVQQKAGETVAKGLLFFGCRRSDHDFIYREELEEYERLGLVDIVTAFSREGSEKMYVQDRLIEHGPTIWEAIKQGGSLYVCGDAAGMAAGVRESLTRIVSEQGGLGTADAESFLDKLAEDNRYLLDVWVS
jgi:cytochrome P450 / NADPH-cytochrome P450 reductase